MCRSRPPRIVGYRQLGRVKSVKNDGKINEDEGTAESSLDYVVKLFLYDMTLPRFGYIWVH
jgi:hypothetical protein